MSMPPLFFFEPSRLPPAHPKPRRVPASPGRIATRIEALVTVVCVTAGLILALSTLPPAPSPGHAVEAFVEASIEEDWPVAWVLLCRPAKVLFGDVDAFADRMHEVNMRSQTPRAVLVHVDAMHRVSWPQGHFLIADARIRSADPQQGDWWTSTELPVALENTTFRVCPITR